jgi:hypothetical protein
MAKNDFSVSVDPTRWPMAHCLHFAPVRRYDNCPPLRATSTGNAADREANYRHERHQRACYRVLRLSQSCSAQRSCSLRCAPFPAWEGSRASGPLRVTVMRLNEHWGGPCGLECPGVDRVIRHDPGRGIFHWARVNRLAYATKEEYKVFQAEYLVLRFLNRCHNVLCDNWTPRPLCRH